MLCTIRSIVVSADYCSLSCNGTQHLMCKNSCQPTGKYCGISAMPLRILYEEIWEILRLHNEYRSALALSKFDNRQPARFNALSYTMDLQRSASCAVNMCGIKNLDVEYCVKTEKYPHIGQNYILYTPPKGEKGIVGPKGIKMCMKKWFSEHKYGEYDQKSVKNWIFNETFKHFTQMVWGDTKYIGCAAISINKQILFGCHYATGIQLGQELYHQMADNFWCNECDPDMIQCHLEFNGLCGNMRILLASDAKISCKDSISLIIFIAFVLRIILF